MIRLGIVSLESTHVDAFCRIFNSDSSEPSHLDGAQVIALCSQDNSPERIEQLQHDFGIETVLYSPADLVPLVDAALMLGRAGSRHAAQAMPFLEAGLPCFVDKPFAHDLDDAWAMVQAAEAHGAPLMSCSGLRFCDELAAALDELQEEVLHASLVGPGELYFYGIHLTDLLNAVMGPGVECVANLGERDFDLLSVSYGDGRSASLQLLRNAQVRHQGELFTDRACARFVVESHGFYRNTMVEFLEMVETGTPLLEYASTVETVAMLVAADLSARQGGRAVRLSELRPSREQMVPSLR